MFGKKKRQPEPEPSISRSGGSDIEEVRREWPASDLDATADLKAWREGQHIYDRNDDYQSMMRAGRLMCRALRHHLYGEGILAAQEFPETAHSVLFASSILPSDDHALTEQARSQLRLALTVCKKHGWQPDDMGGDGKFRPIFESSRFDLFSAAVIPPGEELGGVLFAFFTTNPVNIQPASPSPPYFVEQASFDRSNEEMGVTITAVREVVAKADAGDPASQARLRGFAAHEAGDRETELRHYEEAARLGDPAGMFEAGCLCDNLGRTEDSARWWEAAADAGYGEAATNLGARAVQDRDLPQARQWFMKATELGDSSAYAALTQMAYDAHDSRAEFHWSCLGAKAEHSFCLIRHGQLLMEAKPDDEAELQRALAMFEQSAAKGRPKACFSRASPTGGSAGFRRRAYGSSAEAAGHPDARGMIGKYGCNCDDWTRLTGIGAVDRMRMEVYSLCIVGSTVNVDQFLWRQLWPSRPVQAPRTGIKATGM